MKKKSNKLYLYTKKRAFQKIQGTTIKPRLSLFKSNKHIYAQIINDKISHTLVTYNTLIFYKKFSPKFLTQGSISYCVGMELAKKAKERIITKIVFDRQKHIYHGNIKLLAEGARDYGLIF